MPTTRPSVPTLRLDELRRIASPQSPLLAITGEAPAVAADVFDAPLTALLRAAAAGGTSPPRAAPAAAAPRARGPARPAPPLAALPAVPPALVEPLLAAVDLWDLHPDLGRAAVAARPVPSFTVEGALTQADRALKRSPAGWAAPLLAEALDFLGAHLDAAMAHPTWPHVAGTQGSADATRLRTAIGTHAARVLARRPPGAADGPRPVTSAAARALVVAHGRPEDLPGALLALLAPGDAAANETAAAGLLARCLAAAPIARAAARAAPSAGALAALGDAAVLRALCAAAAAAAWLAVPAAVARCLGTAAVAPAICAAYEATLSAHGAALLAAAEVAQARALHRDLLAALTEGASSRDDPEAYALALARLAELAGGRQPPAAIDPLHCRFDRHPRPAFCAWALGAPRSAGGPRPAAAHTRPGPPTDGRLIDVLAAALRHPEPEMLAATARAAEPDQLRRVLATAAGNPVHLRATPAALAVLAPWLPDGGGNALARRWWPERAPMLSVRGVHPATLAWLIASLPVAGAPAAARAAPGRTTATLRHTISGQLGVGPPVPDVAQITALWAATVRCEGAAGGTPDPAWLTHGLRAEVPALAGRLVAWFGPEATLQAARAAGGRRPGTLEHGAHVAALAAATLPGAPRSLRAFLVEDSYGRSRGAPALLLPVLRALAAEAPLPTPPGGLLCGLLGEGRGAEVLEIWPALGGDAAVAARPPGAPPPVLTLLAEAAAAGAVSPGGVWASYAVSQPTDVLLNWLRARLPVDVQREIAAEATVGWAASRDRPEDVVRSLRRLRDWCEALGGAAFAARVLGQPAQARAALAPFSGGEGWLQRPEEVAQAYLRRVGGVHEGLLAEMPLARAVDALVDDRDLAVAIAACGTDRPIDLFTLAMRVSHRPQALTAVFDLIAAAGGRAAGPA